MTPRAQSQIYARCRYPHSPADDSRVHFAVRILTNIFSQIMAEKIPEETLTREKIATGEEDLRVLLEWETPDVAASFRAAVSTFMVLEQWTPLFTLCKLMVLSRF